MAQLLLKEKPIATIQGVLFDKDGTLSHSEPNLVDLATGRIDQAVQRFHGGHLNVNEVSQLKKLLSAAYGVNSRGIHPGGTIAVASRNQNLISTATVFCLLGESWPQALALADEIFAAVDARQDQAPSTAETRPLLPGVISLLQSLRTAGVICAVISNDTSSGIKSFLSQNNLHDSITEIWSAEHQPAKPNPDAVKALCKLIKLAPAQCALIGDADSDLQMARQAGIGISLGFMAGWNQPPILTAHQHLIHHWDDLTVRADTKIPHNFSSP
ncbi:MAG: HAD family hydrolase [Prochlorococcus sp.]